MARQSKRTPKRDAIFFETLAHNGIVTYAAKVAGYARVSVYEYRRDDPDFAARWEEAIVASTENLEAEAYRRAAQGTESFVVSNGKVVLFKVPKVSSITGEIELDENGEPILEAQPLVERKYSDTLLIFLLKARKPATYRERYDLNIGKQEPEAADLSDADLERIANYDNSSSGSE